MKESEKSDSFGRGGSTLGTPPAIVAISGPDNVGKTTNIRLLSRRTNCSVAGPLDAYDPRWAAAKQDLAAWWFETAPLEEVVDVLACSYLARSHAAQASPDALTLLDRGMTMLDASVIATIATRYGASYLAAVEQAHRILAPYAGDIAAAKAAEWEVELLHDSDPSRAASKALSRERTVTDRYIAYQAVLNHHLAESYPEAIVAGDRPIMHVHGQICRRLRELGVPVPTVAITSRWTIALGGMSESGKSTAGDHLQHEHGCTRLKIGHLLDCAAARHRITDLYALPAAEQAELLALELDRYAAAHHYQPCFSIESLHSRDLTRELGKLLGNALTTVYLDASQTMRCRRGTQGPDDVVERDKTKRARGADQVRDIADAVIDNNCSGTELGHALDRLVRDRLWTLRPPRVVPVSELGLPDHLGDFVAGMLETLTGQATCVDMVAVTGSGARGKYLAGWSDLDVLIVAEPTALPRIGSALRVARARLDGVKLGLTVITPG